MKKFIILLFIASLLFAVKSVPRIEKAASGNNHRTKVETVNKKKPNQDKRKAGKNKQNDHFRDADSNSINDQREDDFQKIKSMKTKFKDLRNKSKR